MGRVRKNRKQCHSYVQSTFEILDSSHQRVGTALANINGLRPMEVWKFKAVYVGDDGKRYRLGNLTGF